MSGIADKKLLVALLACALSAGTAQADAIGCNGVVTEVSLEPNGDTYVGWGSWYTRICNIHSTWTVDRGSAGGAITITPPDCASLVTLFMNARATHQPVTVYVAQSNCTFPSNTPNPYPWFFKFQ